MDRRTVFTGLTLAAASLGIAPIPAWAKDGKDNDHDHDDRDGEARSSVTVSFGAGLNTNQAGNPANHHVLPSVIRVKKDGVVNFVVAGFHQIIVFQPGVVTGQIVVPATGLFIFEPSPPTSLPTLYVGLRTAGGPPPGIPATANPANASNRVESVSFPAAGDYLVICNVIPHYRDGMMATVRVR
jgi:plastocyanin